MTASLSREFSGKSHPKRIINGILTDTRTVAANLPLDFYEEVKNLAEKKGVDIQALVCSALAREVKEDGGPEFNFERARNGRPRRSP